MKLENIFKMLDEVEEMCIKTVSRTNGLEYAKWVTIKKNLVSILEQRLRGY